jgi:hypothetical protein
MTSFLFFRRFCYLRYGIIHQGGMYMRTCYRFILLTTFCLFVFSGPLFAYPNDVRQNPIGVLFIGDPFFRMADFYQIVEEKLLLRFPQLVVGEDIQSKYRKYYWDVKGLLKEADLPSRQELFAFLKTTPYRQVLVLVVSGPNAASRYTFLWYFTLTQSQATMQVRALLIDPTSQTVIADEEIVQKGPLSIHGDLSAKRGCFRLAMEYLALRL